jgi:hypothetical protein
VTGIDIGGEHAVKGDDLAVVEPDRNRPALLHGDALHARVDADLPAMIRKLRGERARDIVHAAFDDADANVLHG